jgi:hypothetical protein
VAPLVRISWEGGVFRLAEEAAGLGDGLLSLSSSSLSLLFSSFGSFLFRAYGLLMFFPPLDNGGSTDWD